MSVQDLYFRIMDRACAALSGHSDAWTALAFGRLGRTFELMDLRLSGGQGLTLDRRNSGLPILNEAVGLMLDIRNGVDCPDSPAALRQEMLDFMMARRRMPEPALVARMARAIYAESLRPPPSDIFSTEPETVELGSAPWGGLTYGGWDFWDGVAASPVTVRCGFDTPLGVPEDAGERLAVAARLFSGGQFNPVTLASEIDERLNELRLKEIVKMTVGPFNSPVFSDAEGGFAGALARVDDVDMAWTLSWTVETLRSAGTAQRGGGLFSRAKTYELFAVDTLDPDRAARGVSDFDVHTLMPHAVYQAVVDDPEAATILQGRRVHVLSGHECTLTEDV